MVLRPSRNVLDFGTQQRWDIKVDGHSLEYFSQDFGEEKNGHDLVIVKFPGTSGRAERSSVFPGNLLDSSGENSSADASNVSGLVLTWNPPGYGRSGGRSSLAKMMTAGKRFFSEVLDRHADGAIVWLCGNSLGCNVALSIAADDMSQRIGGMILRNPPPLIPVVQRVASKYPMGKYIRPIAESLVREMNAEKTAPQSTAPAVFLKSMSDNLVPPKMQDRLIETYGGPNRVVSMDGLEHDGIPNDEHQKLISEALVWLWQQRLNPLVTKVP